MKSKLILSLLLGGLSIAQTQAETSSNPGVRWICSTERSRWQELATTNATAAADTNVIRLDAKTTFQTIDGFGGCFNELGWEALVALPADKRERLEELQTELAEVTQKYGENVLDATNAWELVVTDESRLRGLPAHAVAAARRGAEGKGHGSAEKPAWRFTLHMPSQEPVMTYADDESLRRVVWSAAVAVGGSWWVHAVHVRNRKADEGRANFLDRGQPVVMESWANEAAHLARVKYRGTSWDARVTGDSNPVPGSTLYIDAQDGNTLVVVPARPQ